MTENLENMSASLQQYLDLYADHCQLICEKSVEGFNRLRDEAYRNLKVTGLPKQGEENYEIIDIPEMLKPDYGLNIARIPIDVNIAEGFKCGLPHLSSSMFFLLNDRWAERRGARESLPEGIEIGPLSHYLNPGGAAENYYGKVADLANPLVALNTMLVQEGLYIRVKKDVKVERPVQLINLLENTMPLMAVRRLLIILEENASLKLLSCDHCSAGIDMASILVAEIIASRGSRLEYYDMEESSASVSRVMSLYSRQETGSEVVIENFTLHNGVTRNEYHCSLDSTDASLRLCGMGIEGGKSILDNYSHISHNAKDCHTDELFKYILEDESKGAFTGRIYVAPGASGTEAYQSNRNLVGSNRVRMHSKPQLEIYNDDVKCSHGSATGQLDAMQLFYMRQRGLSDAEARMLLKQAFMSDIIEGVSLIPLRDRLHSLVERRLSGEEVTCSECDLCHSSTR